MAAIKSKNSKAEIAVRKLLHSLKYRFRLHREDIPGKPDIYLPKYKTIIFIHGCFWHQHSGCKYAKMPKSNREYWRYKLTCNVERDFKVQELLRHEGYNVIVIWECEVVSRTKKDLVIPDNIKLRLENIRDR